MRERVQTADAFPPPRHQTGETQPVRQEMYLRGEQQKTTALQEVAQHHTGEIQHRKKTQPVRQKASGSVFESNTLMQCCRKQQDKTGYVIKAGDS
jgi:UDP-N-acetylenolpyruvoylglucosamine reductase